jgi:hypothetical protein
MLSALKIKCFRFLSYPRTTSSYKRPVTFSVIDPRRFDNQFLIPLAPLFTLTSIIQHATRHCYDIC